MVLAAAPGRCYGLGGLCARSMLMSCARVLLKTETATSLSALDTNLVGMLARSFGIRRNICCLPRAAFRDAHIFMANSHDPS